MTAKNATTGFIGWKEGVIALGLVVFSLALYTRTLVPGLIPNDSSEFQTLAYTLGHAHTTGYHVYLLLAKLFTLVVPLGDIAYRVNLFSAFCGSLTVGLVFLAGKMLSGSRWGALTGAFALAIAATFWSQAIIAEVYTAGSLFTAAVLLFVLLWYRTGTTRWLFFAGLFGGLGISVHSSNALFAPAILLLNFLRGRDSGKTWKPALAGALLGVALVIAAFIVIDAQQTHASMINSGYLPSISRWDLQPDDLSTPWGRFAFLVFARQWRSAMFADPGRVVPGNIKTFINTLPQDFAVPILVLSIIGLVAVFVRDRKLGLFFVMSILVHSLYTLNYKIGDIYVFFISLYVYLAVLIAEGVTVLLRVLSRQPGRFFSIARPVLALLLIVLTSAPFAAGRLEALKHGEIRFKVMDLATNQKLESWHRSVSSNVDQLPENAIVLMDWYNLYGYVYAAQVEQNKPDMWFIEAYPYSTKRGMADSLFVFLREQIQQGRPVYALTNVDELQRNGFRVTGKTVGGSRVFVVEMR